MRVGATHAFAANSTQHESDTPVPSGSCAASLVGPRRCLAWSRGSLGNEHVMAVRNNRIRVKITHEFQLESIPERVIEAARKVAAARAKDPEDCALLLDVLGLQSSGAEPSITCLRCGKEYARRGTGRKSCFCSKGCYLEALRVERATHHQNPANKASTSSPYPVKRRPWRPPHAPASPGPPSEGE